MNTTATVVERLDAAGAILVAKLTLGEFAQGDVWFGGMTKNPWKTDQGSSGSSAGPGSATAALILGICAIVLCWPICGPLAVVYGNKAKNEIARSNGNLTGGGLATAGLIMGWIGIAFTVLLVVLILIGLAANA